MEYRNYPMLFCFHRDGLYQFFCNGLIVKKGGFPGSHIFHTVDQFVIKKIIIVLYAFQYFKIKRHSVFINNEFYLYICLIDPFWQVGDHVPAQLLKIFRKGLVAPWKFWPLVHRIGDHAYIPGFMNYGWF